MPHRVKSIEHSVLLTVVSKNSFKIIPCILILHIYRCTAQMFASLFSIYIRGIYLSTYATRLYLQVGDSFSDGDIPCGVPERMDCTTTEPQGRREERRRRGRVAFMVSLPPLPQVKYSFPGQFSRRASNREEPRRYKKP